MRTITVSTDVFAKLWAAHEAGEETEDDILRRILGCPKAPISNNEKDKPQGVYDARNKVNFFEGFEVFRHYKGVEYRAVATNGRWHLKNNDKLYTSLNQLTKAVSGGSANAWVSWDCLLPSGKEAKVSMLRNNSGILVSPKLKEGVE